MTLVWFILLVLASASIVWAVATALVARILGATILQVHIFVGPSLRIFRLGEAEIRLGLLPIGSSVRFLDVDAIEEAVAERAGRRLFEELPLAARLSIHLAGWVLVFLFAQVVLGWSAAASELAQGFGQIFRFFYDRAYPGMALASLSSELSQGLWDRAAAVVALKVIAINLLPLPIYTGGMILVEIASALVRRTVRWPSSVLSVSLFVYLAVLVIFVRLFWKALTALPQ